MKVDASNQTEDVEILAALQTNPLPEMTDKAMQWPELEAYHTAIPWRVHTWTTCTIVRILHTSKCE